VRPEIQEDAEMIMSTNSVTATQPRAGAALNAIGRALIRCWAAYMTWRIERLAVARLGAMSDRQLRDLGIVRSQIEFAVKNGIGRGRVARRCL
jgi:uncharacterized protein YjiS (DUF1127 family)